MSRLFLGIAALALVAVTPPVMAAQSGGSGSPDARASHGVRHVVHKSRHHQARRHHTRRHDARRYYAHPWSGGGHGGGYAAMPGDPLGLNPAVEHYRRQGRCVTDEGYGRYSFCDDF